MTFGIFKGSGNYGSVQCFCGALDSYVHNYVAYFFLLRVAIMDVGKVSMWWVIGVCVCGVGINEGWMLGW